MAKKIFYCAICKKQHRYSSKIGIQHLHYQPDFLKKGKKMVKEGQFSNWKLIVKERWTRIWKHEPTKVTIEVSGGVDGNPPADKWYYWETILTIDDNSRYVLFNIGDDVAYETDEFDKKEALKLAKQIMKQSNNFKYKKQFFALKKKIKK